MTEVEEGVALPERSILFYDGTCGFCAESVQFVLRREKPGEGDDKILFATLAGPFGDSMRRRFPGTAGVDSIVLFEPANGSHNSHALVRSDAALEVARGMGGLIGFVAGAARLVPRPLRDWAYDFIARHRHQIAGAPACLLPTPEQRSRFLDAGW